MKSAVIYTRVSTDRQDTDRQILELQNWAKANNYNVVQVFEDIISGKTVAAKRKGAQALFAYIGKHNVSIVLTSEISRLGRSVMDVQKNIDMIINTYRTNLYIHQQGMMAYDRDGNKNTVFKLITDILANVAQMERQQLSQRIKSGLAAARKKGRIGGRPKGVTATPSEILRKYPKVVREIETGLSLRKVAKLCDCSIGTVQKVKKALLANSK